MNDALVAIRKQMMDLALEARTLQRELEPEPLAVDYRFLNSDGPITLRPLPPRAR